MRYQDDGFVGRDTMFLVGMYIKHCGGISFFYFQTKRWYVAIKLHGVTRHKVVILIFDMLRYVYK
jgi:hypothetical protein